MANDVTKELAALPRMSVAALREKYAEVFGEATTTGNRTWLVRRIAWRIQVHAEGEPHGLVCFHGTPVPGFSSTTRAVTTTTETTAPALVSVRTDWATTDRPAGTFSFVVSVLFSIEDAPTSSPASGARTLLSLTFSSRA